MLTMHPLGLPEMPRQIPKQCGGGGRQPIRPQGFSPASPAPPPPSFPSPNRPAGKEEGSFVPFCGIARCALFSKDSAAQVRRLNGEVAGMDLFYRAVEGKRKWVGWVREGREKTFGALYGFSRPSRIAFHAFALEITFHPDDSVETKPISPEPDPALVFPGRRSACAPPALAPDRPC